MFKGIILAGGTGTRLHPMTRGVSKQLMPVYNKPMIYYPLSVLMLAGIRDILVITTPHEQESFKRLLNSGENFGINVHYAVQARPEGLAQAFVIGKEFIGKDPVALILGDNIYYGHGLPKQLRKAAGCSEGATVFAYMVKDPERYGVIEFDAKGTPVAVAEKPKNPRSHWAVTGLYFYDNNVVQIASDLKPSSRGELEITDVNGVYLSRSALRVEKLGRGTAWLDTGTFESLLQASVFIQTLEERQGLMVSCPEEIAFRMGYMNADKVLQIADSMKNNSYGRYLREIVTEALGR